MYATIVKCNASKKWKRNICESIVTSRYTCRLSCTITAM